MRLGVGTIRITLTAELEWQRRMQEESEELEILAVRRAIKAGEAAVKSDNHVSKRGRRPQSEPLNPKAKITKTGADPPSKKSEQLRRVSAARAVFVAAARRRVLEHLHNAKHRR